jgi:hypothetical protein
VQARSTTVPADRGRIDAGVRHVDERVVPLLSAREGCVGLSFLVDRRSGGCILTSAWRSANALRAAEGELRGIAGDVAEVLGGSPEDEDWEIAVLHRAHHARPGTWVRATWVRVEPDRCDRGVDLFRLALLPEIASFPGFCSVSLLVDPARGYAVSSVAFDSRDAMMQTRRLAAVVRDEATREASGEIMDVGEFELAVAHLRAPETA